MYTDHCTPLHWGDIHRYIHNCYQRQYYRILPNHSRYTTTTATILLWQLLLLIIAEHCIEETHGSRKQSYPKGEKGNHFYLCLSVIGFLYIERKYAEAMMYCINNKSYIFFLTPIDALHCIKWLSCFPKCPTHSKVNV